MIATVVRKVDHKKLTDTSDEQSPASSESIVQEGGDGKRHDGTDVLPSDKSS